MYCDYLSTLALAFIACLYILHLEFHYMSLSNYLFFELHLCYGLFRWYIYGKWSFADNMLLVWYYLLLPYRPVDLFLLCFVSCYSSFRSCFLFISLSDFLPVLLESQLPFASFSFSFPVLSLLSPFFCCSIPNLNSYFFLLLQSHRPW